MSSSSALAGCVDVHLVLSVESINCLSSCASCSAIPEIMFILVLSYHSISFFEVSIGLKL